MSSRTWIRQNPRAGDTVSSITARYGVSKDELLRVNGVTPAADHTEHYLASRAQELKLPAKLPTAAAQKVIEEDDISVWVSDSGGRAVEITPGSLKDISRFATCPPGKYAIFAADSLIYLPEFVVKDAALPLQNIKTEAPATALVPKSVALGGPMTAIARSFARIPQKQRKFLGNYMLGSVPADAVQNFNVRAGNNTSGADSRVQQVQAALNVNGAKPALVVDGVFGPLTEAAVKGFQIANGLQATGVVDGPTSLMLQDDNANSIGTKPTKAAASSTPWGLIIGGGLTVAAVGGGIWYVSRRKRK